MNAPTHHPVIGAGFADPVREAQTVFRAVLDAMAEPGREIAVTGLAEAPAPLSPSAAAIVATLCDFETTLWRDAALRMPSVDAWLAFHTGALLVTSGHHADFGVIAEAEAAPGWDTFARGSDLDPSRSTTLILQVAGFGAGRALRLTGPGIETTREIAVSGAPADLAARATAFGPSFPRGLDLILAGPTSIVALPRTTRIEEIG